MRCEQVRSLLNDYCEGSLSEAMRERVEAHLRGCAACQREVQFVQAIWRRLSAMPEVAPPADLHARIMTHVRANTRAREAQGRIALWRWAGAAAVAAGLFVMGFFAAQSDGVQAAFGFGAKPNPPVQTPQPVQAGVFLEYRTTADGVRVPVLEARMNRECCMCPRATRKRNWRACACKRNSATPCANSPARTRRPLSGHPTARSRWSCWMCRTRRSKTRCRSYSSARTTPSSGTASFGAS